MAVIENLDVLMGAQTAELDAAVAKEIKNLDRLRDAANGMGFGAQTLNDFTSSVTRSVMGLGGLVGSMASVSKVAHVFHETAMAIDTLADQAAMVGVSYNDLLVTQRTLGEVGGLSAEQVNSGLKKMQLTITSAKDSNNDLAKSLRGMGLDANDLGAGSATGQLQAISQAFGQIEGHAERIKFATDIFGKAGVDWVPALEQSAQAIADMDMHLERAGLKLSEMQASGVGYMNDQLERANDHAKGFASTLTADVAPAIGFIGKAMDSVMSGGGFAKLYEWQMAIMNPMAGLAFSGINQAGLADIEAGKPPEMPKTLEDNKAIEDTLEQQSRLESIFQSQIQSLEYQLTVQREGVAVAQYRRALEQGLSEDQAQRIMGMHSQIEDAKQQEEARRKQEQAVQEAARQAAREADAEKDRVANKLKNDEAEAKRIKEDSLSADQKLTQEAIKLLALKQQGLLTDAEFKAAMGKAEAASPGIEYKGAVSAQKGSVDAYKMLLERERGAINEMQRQTRIHEATQKAIEQMANQMARGVVIGRAR